MNNKKNHEVDMKGLRAYRIEIKVGKLWESPPLHILLTKEDEVVVARCLDFTVSSHGNDEKTALKTISKLRSILNVLPFTDKEIGESLNSRFKDFEDGVQYFIALNNSINNLITRNISDYRNLDINVLTPKDFLNLEKIKRIIESRS